jgi:hypothetical protein
MSLEEDVTLADSRCPCWEAPWSSTKCRNCAAQQKHHVDDCEWRGHAAIRRVVQMTRVDALEHIKGSVDKDPAISSEVRRILQGAV